MKDGKRQSQRHQKLKPRTHDEERRETAEIYSHSPVNLFCEKINGTDA
jgi:hypothetical protein